MQFNGGLSTIPFSKMFEDSLNAYKYKPIDLSKEQSSKLLEHFGYGVGHYFIGGQVFTFPDCKLAADIGIFNVMDKVQELMGEPVK